MSSIFQDRGIGNTSLSTFGVAQAALEIILMLYPFSDTPAMLTFRFVCGQSSMLHGQEQHCPASSVYSGHSSAGHLPEDLLCRFITFYRSWKGADLGYFQKTTQLSFSASREMHLVLDWLAAQLFDGVLSRWLLQPASLWGSHSQEGWHNHDNGEDGMGGLGVGWSGGKGAEIAPEVLMCLRPPAFHLFPLFFPLPLSRLPLPSELLLLTNVFLRAPQWL